MESLQDTSWDVILSGTGLSQSLLALALSRSGKKILHVDKNDYYGGAEAALSLQEAEIWVESINSGACSNLFHNASISKPDHNDDLPRLHPPRSYSLSLAPQIIYTRSNLLPALVSSKVYRQLEFLALGGWYIYEKSPGRHEEHDGAASQIPEDQVQELQKIPGSREDVFADHNLDLRSTRSLMKFLKLAADTGIQAEVLSEWRSRPFTDYLTSQFKVPVALQSQLTALTLSPDPPKNTTTGYALPRVHRHLTSIGMFGPGFGAVIPKWGGLAEVAQVACRAGAVGGGVYVLKKGIKSIETAQRSNTEGDVIDGQSSKATIDVELDDGVKMQTQWVAGTSDHLPKIEESSPSKDTTLVQRSITIVSSPLLGLFPPPAEGCPALDGAVVCFPTGSLDTEPTHSPIYLSVHTSATGECPVGQCVIYATYTPAPASAPASSVQDSSNLLPHAITTFLSTIHESPPPTNLWTLNYQQSIPTPAPDQETSSPNTTSPWGDHVIQIPDIPPSLVLEDEALRNVRAVWERIVADDDVVDVGGGFMKFEDREAGEGGDDE